MARSVRIVTLQSYKLLIGIFVDIKEHVAITIFASTAAESALAISIFAADDLYYNIQVSPWF